MNAQEERPVTHLIRHDEDRGTRICGRGRCDGVVGDRVRGSSGGRSNAAAMLVAQPERERLPQPTLLGNLVDLGDHRHCFDDDRVNHDGDVYNRDDDHDHGRADVRL
jgi:hypothetical protein